jgi:putative acyl-CoA dehydrogenase
MPRLYREAPLASIWEGSGNVAALDVLRAVVREPATVDALFAELDLAAGADRRLDGAVLELKDTLAAAPDESQARRIAERIALVLQASLLVRHGYPAVADAFCVSRLSGDWGHAYGTLPAGLDLPAIIERSTPAVTSLAARHSSSSR